MTVRIEPAMLRRVDGDVIRSCKVVREKKGRVVAEEELWFRLDGSVLVPDDSDCDAYLLSIVMQAMQDGENIKIGGSVCKQLLSNLVEYQHAWAKWRPNQYEIIDVDVEEERYGSQVSRDAVCAFSGGVDATFSVWRHSQSRYGHRSQDIKICSLVHGFDIPLNDPEAFRNNLGRAKELLAELNIEVVPIATNFRAVSKVNWEHSFSIAVVAALSNLKRLAGVCIVGSSRPYDSLVIPWGSSPITDHLLGSSEFVVIHDGASHSRTEKVAEIADWESGVQGLRVCWQGALKDANCGVCEKCVRTKLNFLANKLPIPECFPPSDILENLKTIRLRNDAVRAEWKYIFDFAKANGVDEPWIQRLPRVISRKSFDDYIALIVGALLPVGSRRREVVKRAGKHLRAK